MGKKGQVTVFIIIGFLVASIIGLVVWKISSLTKASVADEGTIEPSKLNPVNTYVEMCLGTVGNDAMAILGKQGRIYPKTYMQSASSSVSYFYYKGQGLFPYDIGTLEADVSRYVKENIKECLDDFSGFDYEFTTRDNELKVTTSFNEEDAVLMLDYPITVKIGSARKTLKSFNSRINIKFMPIYDLSRQIYQKTQSDPEWLDVDFLAEQEDYDIKLVKVSSDTMMYEITDSSGMNSKPFTYRFAMKYDL
jgi:hypothetical protein